MTSDQFSGYMLDDFINRLKHLRNIAGNVPVCIMKRRLELRWEMAAVEVQNVTPVGESEFVSNMGENTEQVISIF